MCFYISPSNCDVFVTFNFWKLPNFANIANDVPTANTTDKEDEEQQKIKIDELPDVMLANIASFLDLQSFIRFERSNRFIFTTVRSMPTIKLTAETFMKYLQFTMDEDNVNESFYDLDRFKSSKHLHIDLKQFSHFNVENWYPCILLSDLSICQNLSSLKISLHDDFDIKPDLELYIFCELKAFESLSNITAFSFAGSIEDLLCFDSDILARMVNLEKIYIDNYQAKHKLEPVFIERFASCLSNLSKLRALSFFTKWTPNMNPIFRAVGHQLEKLDLRHTRISDADSYDEAQFDDVNLQNLKELCLSAPSKTVIDCLLNQCGMEKLEIIVMNASYDYVDLTNEYKQSLISLFSLKTIQRIHVSSDNDEKQMVMMKIIESAVKRNKYEEMKIRLQWAETEVSSDAFDYLTDLIKTMQKQCNSFGIMCTFVRQQTDNVQKLRDRIDEFMKASRGIYSKHFVGRTHTDGSPDDTLFCCYNSRTVAYSGNKLIKS